MAEFKNWEVSYSLDWFVILLSGRVLTHIGLHLKGLIPVLMLNIISELKIVLTVNQKNVKYDFYPIM